MTRSWERWSTRRDSFNGPCGIVTGEHHSGEESFGRTRHQFGFILEMVAYAFGFDPLKRPRNRVLSHVFKEVEDGC